MVAALQNPDGHPTWLWDRDAVTAWVAGGATLQRRHGVPVAVQRLIDNGILELRGNTWKQGRVAIHQLAARAVRELADAGTLADLASVLADEWLLQITDAESPALPSTLHSNLRPIAALPELPQSTRQAAVALLRFRQPDSPQSLVVETESLDEVATYLRQGGATGLAELADKLAEIGAAEQSLGRSDEAHARYIQAVQIYHQLIDHDESVSDDLRASYLRSLGDLEESLGRSDDARESFARSVRLYERLTETSTDGDLKYLVALAKLHDRLGNPDEKDRVLARVDRFVNQPAVTAAAGADTTSVLRRGDSLWRLGRQLRSLGRVDEARDLLARAVDTYRQTDPTMKPLAESHANVVLREMADIHIETGQWQDAAECLTQAVTEAEWTAGDSHVLLASVQKRLGQLDNVAVNLALAAPSVAEHERPAPPPNEAAYWRRVRDIVRGFKELRLNELLLDAWERGRWDDAVGLGAGVLEIAQKRAEASPGDHEQDLADAHQSLGVSFLQLDRLDEAVDHLTRSAAISQMLTELEPGDRQIRKKLADALVLLGHATAQGGELEEATMALDRSVGILQELADQSSDDKSVHRSLARTLDAQSRVHLCAGRSALIRKFVGGPGGLGVAEP
ncbi:tetratricopeptide repeat protein [Georgenia muralis]